MTLLPLLYPEVFQRFNLTPPRGVLFHGPPGTGKTLMVHGLVIATTLFKGAVFARHSKRIMEPKQGREPLLRLPTDDL